MRAGLRCGAGSRDQSGIDGKSLKFSCDTELGRNRQGRLVIKVQPGPAPDEKSWLESIRAMSASELARRLGVTDRQARRIQAGKLTSERVREHARTEATERSPPVP
jgi:hypothetical protein